MLSLTLAGCMGLILIPCLWGKINPFFLTLKNTLSNLWLRSKEHLSRSSHPTTDTAKRQIQALIIPSFIHESSSHLFVFSLCCWLLFLLVYTSFHNAASSPIFALISFYNLLMLLTLPINYNSHSPYVSHLSAGLLLCCTHSMYFTSLNHYIWS